MKIGIDIDDTLTNTKDIQLIYWKKYYNENPNPEFSENLPSIINEFGNEYIQNFWDKYREELSFTPTFKNNASEVLKRLKENGHTLCIITSRPDEKYHNLKERLVKWFKKNNIPIDIIYTNIRDKGTFCYNNNFDILIDDDIKHIKKANEYGIKAILFNSNLNYECFQTSSWLEIERIINSNI